MIGQDRTEHRKLYECRCVYKCYTKLYREIYIDTRIAEMTERVTFQISIGPCDSASDHFI